MHIDTTDYFDATEEHRLKQFLTSACRDPLVHSRLLNTLSMLEHVGSRKIMASQSRLVKSLSLGTLKHLAEETRHAYFLKRAAESIAATALNYNDSDLLAGPQARLYMGKLDAFVARTSTGPATYLYVTLVVELRAIWFYAIYQAALKQRNHVLNLRSLIAEEKQHLSEMTTKLTSLGENLEARLPVFRSFEATLYANLLTALERSVTPSTHAFP
jgi:hypothetical protein